jgi:hypothetical protein
MHVYDDFVPKLKSKGDSMLAPLPHYPPPPPLSAWTPTLNDGNKDHDPDEPESGEGAKKEPEKDHEKKEHEKKEHHQ